DTGDRATGGPSNAWPPSIDPVIWFEADTRAASLEPDPHRPGIVHPQHRLLQEVLLVERPDRLDLHVALLPGIQRVEQDEDEAGLLHDLTVGLAELARAGEQRETVGEAGCVTTSSRWPATGIVAMRGISASYRARRLHGRVGACGAGGAGRARRRLAWR